MSNYGLEVLYAPGNAIVDIVFVHGLRGHREDTWTKPNKPRNCLWPRDLLPPTLSRTPARILTFGYDADIVGVLKTAAQGRLRDYGNMLVKELVYNRVVAGCLNRPIMFVAHSLGGLIVEKALLVSHESAMETDNQIRKCTFGIIFMGTPHVGSSLASWGGILTKIAEFFRSANKELMQVLQPASEVLADTQQSFHQMMANLDRASAPIELFCFYEMVPISGVGLIVERHSAILARYSNCGIQSNHIDMVKYKNNEGQDFKDVSGQILLWTVAIASRQEKAQSSTVQPTQGLRPVSTPNATERRRVLRACADSDNDGTDEDEEEEEQVAADEVPQQDHPKTQDQRRQQIAQLASYMSSLRDIGHVTPEQQQYIQAIAAKHPELFEAAKQLLQQQSSSNPAASQRQTGSRQSSSALPVLPRAQTSARRDLPISSPGPSSRRRNDVYREL